MRVDGPTLSEMFEVLRLKIVETGTPPKYIRFMDALDNTLCDIDFDDVVEEASLPGEFYFRNIFDETVIRGVVGAVGTVSKFEIRDDASATQIITGSVSITNGDGDITFTSVEWSVGQVAILSNLKLYFPTE